MAVDVAHVHDLKNPAGICSNARFEPSLVMDCFPVDLINVLRHYLRVVRHDDIVAYGYSS
jgi:hypothetical protein